MSRLSFSRFAMSAAVAAVSVSFLSGCATLASKPEDAVRARATGYWQAKVAGDLDKTYAYLPPSYRAVTSLEGYKKSFGSAVQMTRAEVTEVKCETADKCVVLSKLEAKPVLRRTFTPPIVTYYDEVWVREDGQWWLFPTP